MSRWVELYATSPSGKTLFMCRMCGRQSPSPDKDCATPPEVVSWKATLPCAILEEIEGAMGEVAEGLAPEEPKNKVHYTVQLTSPTTGRVTWLKHSGQVGTKHMTIHSEQISELIEKMKPVREPTELERKHL